MGRDHQYHSAMRRLRRVAYLLPLIFLLWACYAWIRSYLPAEISVRSYQGNIAIFISNSPSRRYIDPRHSEFRGVAWAVGYARNDGGARGDSWRLLGIEGAAVTSHSLFGMLLIPYAYVLLPLAALSVLGWRKYRRQRALDAPGHCQNCGYDLRGGSNRCPECGTESAHQIDRAGAQGLPTSPVNS